MQAKQGARLPSAIRSAFQEPADESQDVFVDDTIHDVSQIINIMHGDVVPVLMQAYVMPTVQLPNTLCTQYYTYPCCRFWQRLMWKPNLALS